ncbi:MAG: hypothetical protein CMP28_11315 [Roseibacillus sp.]|nr:hypothetical protein [Roseibacillus sp.]
MSPENTSATVKTRKREKQIIALGEGEGSAALEERFAFDTRKLKKNKSGNYVGAVRSQFDGKKNLSFGGGIGKSTYRAGRYSASEWSGVSEVPAKSYRGKADASRFQRSSRLQGASASHLARSSRFQSRQKATSPYRVSDAREGQSAGLEKPTDSHTDFRRRVFPEPPIMSREDYNRSVEDTRRLLGRDD